MNILTKEECQQMLDEHFADIKSLITKKEKPPSLEYEWLDNAEAARTLRISARLLQQWRTDGLIPFSQMPGKGKIWYRRIDIEKILLDNYNKAFKSFKNNIK